MPFDFVPERDRTNTRKARGATAYQRGAAAEEQVARHYERHGARLLHKRWRGEAGEIDLILQHGGDLLCVEVKSSSTHERAAASLKPTQIHRLFCAAEEFIGALPRGLLTPMRLDVALVDAYGEIEILENALMTC